MFWLLIVGNVLSQKYNYQRQYASPSAILFVNVTHHNKEFFLINEVLLYPHY
jgi:hypothetical protein